MRTFSRRCACRAARVARPHPRVSIADGLRCNTMHAIWREVRAKGGRPWVLHAMGLFPVERVRVLAALNAELGIVPMAWRRDEDASA